MADFSNTPSRPPRKGRTAIGCGCALVILLFSTFILFPALNDGWDGLVDAPWAHAWNGRATLTGTWTGEITSPGGVKFVILLDLKRAKHADGTYYTEKKVGAHINGQAQWCDSQGRHVDQVPIGGDVPLTLNIGYRDQVDQVHIVLEYTDPPPTGGPLPHELNGSWHVDTLTVNPKFAESNGKNLVVTSSDSDQAGLVTAFFEKGDQNTFDALCKKLSGNS